MKNNFLLSAFIIFFFINTYAQKDYLEYYKLKYIKGQNLLEVFKLNNPLPDDLISTSWNCYVGDKNNEEGKNYLMKAALAGFSKDDVKEMFNHYFDSLFIANKYISDEFDINYNKYLNTECDIVNSIKILCLLERDQMSRSFDACEILKDSNIYNCRVINILKFDSINYFDLLKIINNNLFDSKKLMYKAKLGLGLLLMHSTTNDYANHDSIFNILKKEMLKGVISPLFYANVVDRYYIYNKKINYYCNFFDENLPVYDIQNIDKRREEIGLPTLYEKYKSKNKLNLLPKEYKYDTNSIK